MFLAANQRKKEYSIYLRLTNRMSKQSDTLCRCLLWFALVWSFLYSSPPYMWLFVSTNTHGTRLGPGLCVFLILWWHLSDTNQKMLTCVYFVTLLSNHHWTAWPLEKTWGHFRNSNFHSPRVFAGLLAFLPWWKFSQCTASQ